ncbi:MAG TPA: fructosamine kinase family protein [Solirubrobacteraceae bacterium]|jgi:fructosamine-3-kinase|nr:fructosamine kinase family protein [Solirubrobacteraceae bacterium]
MSLPPGAEEAVRVGGGDINQAWRVRLADGRLAFVKTRPDAGEGEYEREASALHWLAQPGVLQVPEVLEVGADYLALEWIEHGSLDAAGAEELGQGLARLHAAGAPGFGDPGLGGAAGPSVVGSLSLPNDPAPDWPTFYAQRRLIPALAAAQQRGGISASGAQAVEAVCERIAELCGPAEPPARLHGDLWSGNVLADAQGRPWLIDPTAYGGHREVDLVMLRLFGAPSPRIFDAYEEVSPLADGWRARVPLYQLLPLLVHAALFGGSYGAAAQRAAIASLS